MAQVTWLGDEDLAAQQITQYGHVFVKGEPTEVPDNDPYMYKFKAMHVFSVEMSGADVADEKAAIKAALDAAGIEYDGRAKIETLRALLPK